MTFGMDIAFNSDHADSIISSCEDLGLDEKQAWLHLLAAAASLCPIPDMSLKTLSLIYNEIDKEGNHD